LTKKLIGWKETVVALDIRKMDELQGTAKVHEAKFSQSEISILSNPTKLGHAGIFFIDELASVPLFMI
jgi:hypothetical protein